LIYLSDRERSDSNFTEPTLAGYSGLGSVGHTRSRRLASTVLRIDGAA